MTIHEKQDRVTLNIGGSVIKTYVTTCRAIEDSLLASLDNNCEYYDEDTDVFYFDRDVNLFQHILAAHRDGIMHVPRDICPIRFRDEIRFWRVPDCMVSPCCWKYFYECDDDMETLKEVIKSLPKNEVLNKIGVSGHKSSLLTNGCLPEKMELKEVGGESENSLKHRIWNFLEEPQSSTAAKIWCFSYMFVVLVSVILNIIWLDDAVRVQPYLVSFLDQFSQQELYEHAIKNETFGNHKTERLLLTDPHPALFIIDCICTGFFAVETIVHFSVCPNKLLYFRGLYNLLKMVLCFCMIYGLIFEIRKDQLVDLKIGYVWYILKSANTLRALLVLRLHKLYSNLRLIYLSLRRSLREMTLLLLLFGLTIVIYGGLIFSTEIQSDMFPDTRKAMWWALITMTTIGYGDFYPTYTAGYVVGLLCAINGLIVIALPIAAISSNFSSIYSRNSDLDKHLKAVEKHKQSKFDETPVEDKTAKANGVKSCDIIDDIDTKITRYKPS